MLVPKVEFIDELDAVPRPPVKKQIWNGKEFVRLNLYRIDSQPKSEVYEWLQNTYGPPGQYVNGCYWNRLGRGREVLMDEKVYMFYTMKWGA